MSTALDTILVGSVDGRGKIARTHILSGIKVTAYYDPLDDDNLPEEFKKIRIVKSVNLAELIIARKVEKAADLFYRLQKRAFTKLQSKQFVKAVIAELPE